MDELTETQRATEPPDGGLADIPGATKRALDENPASLARELGREYDAQLRFRVKTLEEELSDAARRARTGDSDWLDRIPDTPGEHLSWHALGTLYERDPEAALAVWNRVNREADDELARGHRAALALEFHGTPWERARFLAIRQNLVAEWRPNGGAELLLIDQMAIAHAQFLDWTERLYVQGATEARSLARDVKLSTRGSWDPPKVSAADAMDQAAAMAERWQRLFVRAARALRDFRRYAPSVVVNGAAQVNVAAVQQNVARAGAVSHNGLSVHLGYHGPAMAPRRGAGGWPR